MTDHSIFTKRQNPNVKLSTETSTEKIEPIYSSFVSKIKGLVTLNKEEEIKEEENIGLIQKMKNGIKNTVEVEKSYKIFCIFIAVGIGLIFMSLMFLPTIVLFPKKFVSLFSLGSLVSLISFIFIYGTSGYLEMLFEKKRIAFTLLFIGSTLCGLYFAFIKSNYLISLICAVVQLITLVIFALSFIPGGRTGITFITGMLMTPVYSFISRFKK